MNTLKKQLSDIIFPDVSATIADLEKRYPKRNLNDNVIVTRFAPSPTGFLHTGSLFASLVSWRFAKQTDGVFFFRLEDTDQKREVRGSAPKVIEELEIFGIRPDESFVAGGEYGPYVQSERKIIYDTVIKHMIEQDLAYPCFCTQDEIADIRKKQKEQKVTPGYYGKYATCRHMSTEKMIEKIEAGEDYVIRFKSPGEEDGKVSFEDAIRGHIEFPENRLDIVIRKTDGLPTYHFAHLVDDHYMRTTHVTRGEEWMSSVPIHLQLFEAMEWEKPIYCHLPVIKIKDGKNKRKLSKRKDPEASVSFFLEEGYPIEGFLEYLMTLANTNFEEWRLEHPKADIFDFDLSFAKFTLDGGLFDIEKVKSISKERLAMMSAGEIADKAYAYALQYEEPFAKAIKRDYDYFKQILSIERGGEKPRKDYEKYSDIFPIINFMYDDYFDRFIYEGLPFNDRFESEQIIDFLESYKENMNLDLDEEAWFANLKATAIEQGFAKRRKDYKKHPDEYAGHVGDFAEIIRIGTTSRKNTPNFYHVLRIMGEARVKTRIDKVIALLNEKKM